MHVVDTPSVRRAGRPVGSLGRESLEFKRAYAEYAYGKDFVLAHWLIDQVLDPENSKGDQIACAKLLLDRTVPTLRSVEITGEEDPGHREPARATHG